MNYNKSLLLFITCYLAFFTSNAQNVSFHIGSGIGSYQMNQLKIFTDIIKDDLPFPVENVSNFPIYWNYDADLLFKINRVDLGLAYGFQSSGNHLSQGDYSGSYNLKMIVKSHSPGVRCQYKINDEKLQVYIYGTIGVHISSMYLNEEITVYNHTGLDSYKFNSTDVFFEPGLKASYPIKFCNVFLAVGYHIQPDHKPLKLDGDDDAELTNPNTNKPVGLDWTGFRLKAGLGIPF